MKEMPYKVYLEKEKRAKEVKTWCIQMLLVGLSVMIHGIIMILGTFIL